MSSWYQYIKVTCVGNKYILLARAVTVQVTGPFFCVFRVIFSFLARSEERCSLGVDDAMVFPSTSIAFSEALEDRGLGPETRVSGLGVRLSRGPCTDSVCRLAFDDDGAALAATSTGAGGAATGPQAVTAACS